MSEDIKRLRTKFNEEVLESDWELLKPHYSRNALFVVMPELDLVEVAINVALDNVDFIKNAMDSNLLRSPNEEEVTSWDSSPVDKIGKFLIVSPYVFLKKEG